MRFIEFNSFWLRGIRLIPPRRPNLILWVKAGIAFHWCGKFDSFHYSGVPLNLRFRRTCHFARGCPCRCGTGSARKGVGSLLSVSFHTKPWTRLWATWSGPSRQRESHKSLMGLLSPPFFPGGMDLFVNVKAVQSRQIHRSLSTHAFFFVDPALAVLLFKLKTLLNALLSRRRSNR